MILRIVILLVVSAGATIGQPNQTGTDGAVARDVLILPNSIPETVETVDVFPQLISLLEDTGKEEDMATRELNPSHFPAQRAAKVVQHYLNTRYGSPYRLFILQKVHRGSVEDSGESGRRYLLELSVQGVVGNMTTKCSAEVLFLRGEGQSSPQVQTLCDELLKSDTEAEEQALYLKYKTSDEFLSTHNLPDSYGHIEPDMKPLWHLGAVASGSVMLNESTEETLYNMAQVANVTQLASEDDQLWFSYHVLLHDMVSQDIVPWKLLVTWSPPQGVKVLQMEKLPHCHHCEDPPSTEKTADGLETHTVQAQQDV